MADDALKGEERIGLVVAVVVHLALLWVLLIQPSPGEIVTPPDRIEVTISDDVGLTSTSPEPFQDAAPDVAPEIGEAAPPEPVVAEASPPSPAPVDRVAPPRPAPVETRQPAPRPSPRPVERPRPRPAPSARPEAPSRPAARPAPKPAEKAGGSRIGNDFLEGVEGAQSNQRSSSPRAETLGPRVQAALSGAISRQLKPHWIAPQGPDAEELVTILAWNLNRDGSLSGTPRVVDQQGITEVNRAQASRHAEQAIRAVQLAAPFDLPAEYYDGWKRISAFRFDKRLSQ